MADDPTKHGLPDLIVQNPAQTELSGQDYENQVVAQTQRVMDTFLKSLPSNYVSQVNGPWYTLQFQALAEEIARIQVKAQQTFLDLDYGYTRPEFLWQILGQLVFPESIRQGTIPVLDGDVTYREFLKSMVVILLKGATKDAVQEGVQLLTTADVAIIEKVAHAQETGTAWGFDDQFTFEVNIEKDSGTAWPDEDPFVLQENVRLVLKALKPAHTLYEYRHLFRDAFGDVFSGTSSWVHESYHYDDLRGYQHGAKSISGTVGVVHTDRTLFSDPNRDFSSITAGAVLTITTVANKGTYDVEDVLVVPVGDDSTAQTYTTSPTGLTGKLTVAGDVFTDPKQNWALAVEGELLTLSTGVNKSTYLLKTVIGPDGGAVGTISTASTKVRVAPSILRLRQRIPKVASSQVYEVSVDRLGRRVPNVIVSEDVASQFYT